MLSLISIALIMLSAVLVYRKRFTSDGSIRGMYYVQLYYLIISPFVCALFINLGLEIYNRPEIQNLPVSSNLLFVLYCVSVATAGIGAGIHSTSTSVYQSFAGVNQFKSRPFETNENFHGGLSHNMLFLATIASTIILAFLEINHPALNRLPFLNQPSIIGLGIAFGIFLAVAILRSLHIGYSLLASLFGAVLILYFGKSFMTNVAMFPVSFVALSSLLTAFFFLAGTVVIFLISGNLSRKILKRAYPKGHPFHEGISVKVLRIKIEREWL